ncbi:hypothetical protein [Vibrio sp. 99-70-13A1]|uniref:hypothetical protein n=1 Tax=Vibrio sp. 99-70-13A1 TaxID=2607601 RepID=UPI0014938AC8|nr:hypothetical protein [Vibrio sp. 99-70-13A1]NOH99322.1 hypothetical protein [Vibrio sp. 99-70-13A1]
MFEFHIKRTKFLLVLQGIALIGVSLMLFAVLSQISQFLFSDLLFVLLPVLLIASLNVVSFYGLFKKQLWSLKLIMGLYFIQLIGIETPDFSFALSAGVEFPISVTFNELTLTLNILAALVLCVSYTSLKSLKQG